ncbi:snoaL-like domain-containing protein [Aspergillus affinis]|uniref:snoaL-like domain-containing protein n=1 Tax=Aspergillus affinis TaxID=1070780 RepID=UPI0022FEE3DB|nr:snoaL-like domain-containing protein [Aspergillus affinis]KAI9046077.1 snoaL-like domain-containing protein [Aspergillus affinis]
MDLNLRSRLDKEDIRELIVQERYYRDTWQWEKLRACYHPEASQTRVAVTWIDDSIDDFIGAAKQLSDWGENPFHAIMPAVIHIRGDKSVVESKCSIQLRLPEEEGEYDFTSQVRLVSRVERLQGGIWKLLSVETIYEQDSMVPTGPVPGLLPYFKANNRRSSYKHLCWLLERRGFDVRSDLPGTDIPETVEREMKRHFTWLEE